jgi:hypothetical protein
MEENSHQMNSRHFAKKLGLRGSSLLNFHYARLKHEVYSF